jgi:5-methylcytosine-specific restriction endonuclease McrA
MKCRSEKQKAWSRDYYAKNRELIKQKTRAYRKANHAIVAERERRYRLDHLQQCREREKFYNFTHKASRSRYYSAYHQNNKTKIRLKGQRWRSKNKSYVRIKNRERRALKQKVAIGNVQVLKDWETRWRSYFTVKCYWCMEKFHPSKCHVDHIIALAAGGMHSIDNVCISCSGCNIRKRHFGFDYWNKKLQQPVLL